MSSSPAAALSCRNAPVSNAEIESHIGKIGGRASAMGRRALSWNGVKTRHYARAAAGFATHSSAGLCALAISAALDDAGLERGDLTFLAAATTQGDYLVLGHAATLHGELGGPSLEIASFQSVCGSSLIDDRGRLAPQADILRFTLSDEAGALVMESKPRRDGLSLP